MLIAGRMRGYLAASEHAHQRTWDEPAVRLLRTGCELMATFIQQWETSSALRARETQLRALGDNLPNGFIYQYRYDSNQRPTFTYLSSGVF
ncbi:MAG: hypothetical protein AB4911_01785 [Oscillochloridaceae bacterium umkhey_bin13]